MPILEIKGLCKSFGGLRALSEVDLSIEPGEIRGLIGPNGSGKTTLLNVITGYYRPERGSIRFDGRDILRLPTHRIAARGIGRTFQTAEPFPNMSVLQNVLVGRHIYGKSGILSAMLRLGRQREEERREKEKALEALRVVRLEQLQEQQAGSLAFGQLRLLEIARALALEPKMLLLDEPAAGMNTGEVDNLLDLLHRLRVDHKVTLLLIEHNLGFIMKLADTVTVLDHGEKIAEGLPAEVRCNPKVIEAHIGAGNVANPATS